MKTMKNPENPKKHGITFILRVLLTLAVCGYVLYRCAVNAYAVDTTLTLSQTLALYGTSLSVEFTDQSNSFSTPYTLDFVGTSQDFIPDLSTGNLLIDGALGTYNDELGAGDTVLLQKSPYLRYGGYMFPVQQAPATGKISGTFSIDLNGITDFQQCILVTKGTGKNWGTDNQEYNNTLTYNQSRLFFSTSYNPNIRILSATNTSTSRQIVFLTPFIKRSIGADKDLSDDFVMSWFETVGDLNRSEPYNLSGWSVDWVRPSGRQEPDALNSYPGYVEIWIQCPTIGDYTPLVTTTTVPTTTRPQSYTTRPHDYSQRATTPANTVDLSQIESNQRVQIEIENDNRNFNAGSFDALNIIIDQLNDIYAQMQARGEIAVDLLDGLQWSAGTDINSYISGGLTHTTSRLPDSFNPDTINSLSDLLFNNSQLARFAAVGLFSIGFGIFCWFVFRGRGGT